eukprot:COSAG03_NODE_160_length_11366_cov_10.057518_10_plen_143_part_00
MVNQVTLALGAALVDIILPKQGVWVSFAVSRRVVGSSIARRLHRCVVCEEGTCAPGFHNRCTGMPGLNSYSMPGPTTRDTGHKALMPGVTSPHQQIAARLSAMLWAWGCSASVVGTGGKKSGNSACGFEPALSWRAPAARSL